MAMPVANVAPRPKATRPARHVLTIALLSLAVCAVGLGSVFAIKSVGKMSHLVGGRAASSPLASLNEPGADSSASLDSSANQKLVAALSSGNTQQALSEMQASGSTAPSVMQTAPQQTPSTMQSAPPAKTPVLESGTAGMPDDVRNWLEHLHKIEMARQQLAGAQLQQAVKTLVGLQAGDMTHAMDEDGSDSVDAERKRQNDRAQGVGSDMGSMQQAWKTLLSAFNAVPAPAECVGIKANYDQVIGQTGTMILDIIGHIKSASSDPQAAINALTAMQGTSKSRIDVPARASDDGVAKVCRHYDVTKWFDIQGDIGAGTMSQLGF